MQEKKNKLTFDSKIKDLYANPVGHDTLSKVLLQLGIPSATLTNPVVGNMKVSAIANLTKSKLDRGFFETLLNLLNMEEDIPFVSKDVITKKWWKEAVFYQIYPRSFCDSNGDGIGDLKGIISKLDYLKDLGVTALWLSPIYDSPNDDNGYDIRDYRKIMQEFGTMEDFDELLSQVHARGMRLIMDLVINHTSDEHEWFQKALEDPQSKYRDYYLLRKHPNNWTSSFAGSAWNHYEEQGLYGLHLFSKKQMDLNWENEEMRSDVIDMINWWLDKGVDGFRMDVINYISKQKGLPDGNTTIGQMMGFTGIEHYFYGPKLHQYLHEIHEKAFAPHGAFSVGETPGVGMKMAQLITGEERKELDMVFSFDHLETPGHVRYDDYRYDLNYLKDYMIDWMENYGNNCWMSLFYNNHDNPRMISKVNPEPQYRKGLAKLLAVIQFTLKGTPFVFQGDEMGLVNYEFTSMDEVTDVEAKGYYKEFCAKMPEEKALHQILVGTREHARIPLPWNELPAVYQNLKQQESDTEITDFYKQLIALRKSDRTLVYGDFKVLSKKKDRFVYLRRSEDVEYIIDCNLGIKQKSAYNVPADYRCILDTGNDDKQLGAYEARVWKKAL